MQRRKLGASGPEVGAIGLGCMGMSDFYGPADRTESIATIHAALDSGATLIDTGDFYGQGHNEMLIAEALRGRRREDYVLSVKFGALRDPSMGFIGYDARPEAVKNFLTYSLKRLGADHIDVYRPARLDPAVPIEETVGAIADCVAKGYVRAIGLSEVGAATIRRAAKVHPISDLQIEYSLVVRMIEGEILPACRELGIRDHCLWRAGAWTHLRPLVEGTVDVPGLPHLLVAVLGRQSRSQSRAGRRPGQNRRSARRECRSDRRGAGDGAGPRHCAAGRRPKTLPMGRIKRSRLDDSA